VKNCKFSGHGMEGFFLSVEDVFEEEEGELDAEKEKEI
jgi:hypothetical protein